VSDWDDRHERPQRDPSEGVRLIGDDEAEEALERGDASRRLSRDEPRFGDRPPAPEPDGPRPALRFPLGNSDDPSSVERPAPAPVQPRAQTPELSHWSGAAAEEVPNMNRRDPLEGDDSGWSSFSGLGPRWREDAVPVEPPRPPAGGPTAPEPWAAPDVPPDPGPIGHAPGAPGAPSAPGGFDDDEPPAGRSVFGGVPDAPPVYEDAYGDDAYAEDAYVEDGYADDSYTEEPAVPADPAWAGAPMAGDVPPAPALRGGGRRRGRGGVPRAPRPAGRDMRTAIVVGVGLVALALVLFAVLGALGGMLIVVPIIGYATYEFMDSALRAGLQPLMPVGVVASVGTVIAAYNYGEQAIPLGLVLTAAVCFLWYLVNAGGEGPAANIGVTLLGVVWIGVFGSFAALLLSVPTYGVSFLLAAVVPTVAYDVGGLFVGRSAGSRALSPASPNKTIEGLAGGMFLAVVAGAVFGAFGPAPFDGWADGLAIGLVAALAAPIGDLAESLIKRDLDVKDMGNILPGHGGLLDRFDAVLFVLPAIWYLARLSDFFLT